VAALTAGENFKALLTLVHVDLKPLGFTKRGQNFYSGRGDNVGVINFQKHKWSTKEEIRFTVNVGAWSRRLENAFAAFIGTRDFPAESSCQWRQRIGRWIAGSGGDQWWDIDAATDLRVLHDQIAPTILEYALPALRTRSSDEGLRDAWLAECAAGQATSFRNLLFLLNQIGPVERIADVEARFARYEEERPAKLAQVLGDIERALAAMPPPT
jgi:hypothetical protein